MNKDHENFLNLVRLPGTIDAEQTGILLGVPAASVSILVARHFLTPLGKGIASNSPRKFSSAMILALTLDPDQMSRMHHVISGYWRSRNGTANRKRTEF